LATSLRCVCRATNDSALAAKVNGCGVLLVLDGRRVTDRFAHEGRGEAVQVSGPVLA
jgi:hypothetical protein